MQYAFLNRNKSSQLQVRDKSLKDQISGVQNKTVTNFHTPSDLSNSVFQKNTICIPHSEIERIKDSCLINSDPEQERKLRERQELYNKSQERVKNWPNTLHAIRKKKDETRFERFKKEEEERRLIDQQEVLYQANAKRQVIDKANKQIYEGGDRIKAFQSRLLLVDAIQEREGQMELKQQVTEIILQIYH